MQELKYKVGDIVVLKREINNCSCGEIVEIHPDSKFFPYRICQEDATNCDDNIYTWVDEDEIEGYMNE